MSLNKSTLQTGSILPLAMVMALVGLGIVYSYSGWLYNKQFQLNYRIAKVKALYNAESGMAERGYPNLFKSEFAAGTSVPGREISKEMGFYEDPTFFFYPNGNRVARVTGVHEIKNADGEIVPVKSTIELPAELQTLGVYMYLTQSEKAGGAPFVFNTGGTRRSVNFGSGDVLNGVIQTNDPDGLTVSDFGCPDFSDATVYLTNSVDVNLGSCGNYGGLFGGDVLQIKPGNRLDGGFGSGRFGAYFLGGRPPVGEVVTVGEKGRELFVADRSGTVVSNDKTEHVFNDGALLVAKSNTLDKISNISSIVAKSNTFDNDTSSIVAKSDTLSNKFSSISQRVNNKHGSSKIIDLRRGQQQGSTFTAGNATTGGQIEGVSSVFPGDILVKAAQVQLGLVG